MQGLTSALLGQASRTFLDLAYPDGNIPVAKRVYYDIGPDAPLSPLLKPPICQEVSDGAGGVRGYAFRLGCSTYPHLKMRITCCDDVPCVFDVDTHDAMNIPPDHPDSGRLAEVQSSNRQLKQRIERAWEENGLTTFTTLLRRGLEKG